MRNLYIYTVFLLVGCAALSPVKQAMKQISNQEIERRIVGLSSLPDRFWNSTNGVKAADYIVEEVTKCAGHIKDFSVEKIDHLNVGGNGKWIMPSVIARLPGHGPLKDETVIIGGHLDSTNHVDKTTQLAPGADDDASGTSTALEVFCVLANLPTPPNASIEFMAYSAEEVGLWGSNDIAQRYKKAGRKIRAVMQLDMVLIPAEDEAVYLIDDYTNPILTRLVEKIAKEIGLAVRYGTCGYGCSDHASWTKAGYPSVFPFEGGGNRNIHSSRDTLENAPKGIEHASKFAKLGVAFMIEMAYEDKQTKKGL